MTDYKEMYLIMFRAAESAINFLLEAQRKCEEMYMTAEETELKLLEDCKTFDKEKTRE